LAATIVVLIVLRHRKVLADYWALASFLAVRAISTIIQIGVMASAGGFFTRKLAYKIYFYVYWSSYAIEALLCIAIIYGVYRLAMVPLKGLQSLGMLMFRWAAAVAVAVAVGTAFGPHITATKFIVVAVSQLQKTQSILTLCLLLFVTFAIRPMGLTYRSRIFGVSLGLGLMATLDLVSVAWFSNKQNLHSLYDILNGCAILATMSIWTAYFALPEPRRRIIVLPTTSPFLRWNQISTALGDDPGFVAVGSVHPDMFAPAELEVFKRASVRMQVQPVSIGSAAEPISAAR
jgi:hypothetical protein